MIRMEDEAQISIGHAPAPTCLCPRLRVDLRSMLPAMDENAKNLESTFERGDISSWMEFFQRTCFSPLYHDRFPQLVGELRAALTSGDETVADLLAALDKVLCMRGVW